MTVRAVQSMPTPLMSQVISFGAYRGLVAVGTDNQTIWKLTNAGQPIFAGTAGISLGALAYDPSGRTGTTESYWALDSTGAQLYHLVFGPGQYQIGASLVGSLHGVASSGQGLTVTGLAGAVFSMSPKNVLGILEATAYDYGSGAGNGLPSGFTYMTAITWTPDALYPFTSGDSAYICESNSPSGYNSLYVSGPGLIFWSFLEKISYADGSAAQATIMAYDQANHALWFLDNTNGYLSHIPPGRTYYNDSLTIAAASVAAYPGMTWGHIPWPN